MKKHLIRTQREVTILPHYENTTVYHTWCNWDTIDNRDIADSTHVHSGEVCERCMAAIAKISTHSYLVPPDGC